MTKLLDVEVLINYFNLEEPRVHDILNGLSFWVLVLKY